MIENKTGATAKKTAAAKGTVPKAAKRTARPAAKKPAKAAPEAAKKTKKAKVKVVRDSFSMPHDEYLEIARIKDACRKDGLPVKKSEVLRAGLKALGKLSMTQTKCLLAGIKKASAE